MQTINFQLVEFLTSASKLSQCPVDEGAEVAFAGRSNAGKSSCINVLTCHGNLARISKTPGRTQLINFFDLSNDCRLVDLPGYGYAKVPLAVKRHWEKHLEEYLRKRQSLRGIVLLMDIRRPLQDFDLNMLQWATEAGLEVHAVLTKADKFKRGPAQAALLKAKKELEPFGEGVSIQVLSSTKKTGVDELRNRLSQWLSEEPFSKK